MKYVYKALAILIILAALVVVGYAYVGNLSPQQAQVTKPVTLNVQ